MRELKLSKAGETATVEILKPTHLAQVLALQDATRAALSEAQKMFVLPQPNAYFEKLLGRQQGCMIGVWAKGQLIAQMVMMGAVTLDDAVARNLFTKNDVAFHHAEPTDLVVAAKSMAVHPDWRGNELSQFMLESALDLPFVRAADHVFAQMSVENLRSWDLFLREGFGVVAAALDAGDHKPRFIMQKPALGFAFYEQSSVDGVDALSNFSAIMRLCGREALIGCPDETHKGKLAFFASGDTAATWREPEELVSAG
jgi:GNAT superfamily N-acetyltransferase